MSQAHAEATHIIDAPPQAVYAILADYCVGHPAILPRPYFTELTVEQGGTGAGTIIRVRMNVLGQEFRYHQIVSEPEPGRVMVETDMDTGQTSSFTVEPLDSGRRSRVTIAADFPTRPGFAGFMERLLNPLMARRMFKQELRNLDDYLRDRMAPEPA